MSFCLASACWLSIYPPHGRRHLPGCGRQDGGGRILISGEFSEGLQLAGIGLRPSINFKAWHRALEAGREDMTILMHQCWVQLPAGLRCKRLSAPASVLKTRSCSGLPAFLRNA